MNETKKTYHTKLSPRTQKKLFSLKVMQAKNFIGIYYAAYTRTRPRYYRKDFCHKN